MLPFCGWGPGPHYVSQKASMYLTSDVIHKKMKLKTPNFFSLQTRKLAKSFQGLNSSPAQSNGKLLSCKVAKRYGN